MQWGNNCKVKGMGGGGRGAGEWGHGEEGRDGKGALSIHPGPSGPAHLFPHLLALQILPAVQETCPLLEFILVSLDF